MEKRKEKSIKVKLTGDDVDQFEKVKLAMENEMGAKITDSSMVRAIIQYRLYQH